MSTAFTRRTESREIQTNKNKTQKGLLANIEAPFMLMKGGKVILIGQTHWSYLLRSRSGCWSAAGNRRHGTCRLRDGDLHLLRIWRGIWRQARKWERNRERKRYGSGGEVKKKKKKTKSKHVGGYSKNKKLLSNTYHSYTKCEHSEQCTQITIHLLCMPLTSHD